MIQIKTPFSDWHLISKDKALDYAKFKFKNITIGNDQYKLDIINSNFKGIIFTLDELK